MYWYAIAMWMEYAFNNNLIQLTTCNYRERVLYSFIACITNIKVH